MESTEIEHRIERLQHRLSSEGLSGAIFNYAIDVYYFTGTRQNSLLWVPSDGAPILLVRKSLNRACKESSINDVRPFPTSRDLPQVFGRRPSKIGLTFDVMPVQYLNFYRSLLPDCEFTDISAINRELRAVKSEWELDQLRTSGRLLASEFSRIPEFLKPGMREIELAAEFEYHLKKAGIGGYNRLRGFNQEIVGLTSSGGNAAYAGCFDGPVTGKGIWTAAPYGPSVDLISADAPIIIDYGGFYNGYLVDMTRIFCVRRLDAELERAFKVSLDIQDWVTDNLKPGAVCEDLYYGALKIASEAGLQGFFMGHSGEAAKFVGHGVGLELDELPVLAPRFKAPLAAGQTVAVEPKFLFPGKGAIGIENTFAITHRGAEKLTPLADDIVYL